MKSNIEHIDHLTDYQEVLALLQKKKDLRKKNLIKDYFYIVEHKPVFTLGKRGGVENLLKDADFLKSKDICVVPTERGGNITYHGPGQLVIYPVINIKQLKMGIKEYVYRLEQIVIELCSKYDLNALRNSVNHGVWVDNKKLASVGVKVEQGVTLHGIALNVNNDLTPFSWINPCGLKDVKATSLKEQLNRNMDIGDVKKILNSEIAKQFKECFK